MIKLKSENTEGTKSYVEPCKSPNYSVREKSEVGYSDNLSAKSMRTKDSIKEGDSNRKV